MKLLPPKISTLLVCLLILLVTGQGFASGSVLCFQESGHSAFEQAGAGQCGPVESSCPENGELSWASGSHDDCGPCDDVSALSDSLHNRSRGDQDFSLSAPLPWVAMGSSPVVPAFIRDLTANLSPQPPPLHHSALIALRTVVLLN